MTVTRQWRRDLLHGHFPVRSVSPRRGFRGVPSGRAQAEPQTTARARSSRRSTRIDCGMSDRRRPDPQLVGSRKPIATRAVVTRWVTMVPLRDRQMTIHLRVRRKAYRLGVFHSLVILVQLSRSLALWGDARVASIWRFGGDRAAARRAQVAGGGWTKTSTVFSRRWRLTTLPVGSQSPKPSSGSASTLIWRASSTPGGPQ